MMKSRRRKIKNDKVSYSLECSFLKNGSINSAFLKIVAVLVVVSINGTGLLAIGKTFAYFNDTENSLGNIYQAGTLDFSLTNSILDKLIGLNEEVSLGSVLTNNGGLNFQYTATLEKIFGNDNFCNALALEAKLNGIKKYDNSLMSFDVPALTTRGSWSFRIELPVTATNISHGEKCEVDIVFKGWQTNVANYEDSGFSDEERIHLNLTSRMVVLNEFLPRPDGVAYGFNFGSDSSDMPQGEWVELYNNSDTDYDLDGWYIWDASGSESNKVAITNTNTFPATTVISSNSWLVVYMNKAVLNNNGDTVKLFDNTNTLVDSYIYTTDNDYCEIEPTPGDKNTTDTSGSCGGVPPNKSYARIPDGIGYWVDPIPTPGGPNVLESFEYPEAEITEPESEPEIIIELPDIDIIETTTPALEEVIVVEEEPIIEEEPAEELEEVRPLENSDEEVTRGRTSMEAEEVIVEEPEIKLEPLKEPDLPEAGNNNITDDQE